VAVVSANGLAGTVANPTTSAAITLSTTATGILQGNGTAISPITVGSGLTFTSGTLAATGGGSSVINGYINGFTLSNDGTTPNSVLDMALGFAADSTNAVMITGTAKTKTTGGAWVTGTGNAGMGTGLTVAASTWYHVFAIINGGVADYFFDTSPVAAHAPAGTTAFRYVGSFKTDASNNILRFTQKGQWYYWTTAPTDLSSGGATTTTAFVVSAPAGFNTIPILTLNDQSVTGQAYIISGLGGIGGANNFSFAGANSAGSGGFFNGAITNLMTNTSSQLSYAGNGGPALTIITLGYINPHVAPNF
jgi:hypothetical protein